MLIPIVTHFTGSPAEWCYKFSAVPPTASVVFGVGHPVNAPRRLSFDLGETTYHDRPKRKTQTSNPHS